mgnify:CR=1 FL=1
MDTLLQLDKDLFLWLNGLGSPSWDTFWLFITHKLSAVPLYLLLVLLFYKSYGLKRTLVMLLSIGLLITVTDQLANFFKVGVGRLRPCHDYEISGFVRLVKSSCGGKFGYFSAHAANSIAVALFFTLALKKNLRYIGFFLFLWAIAVGYSRIYIGVHYPLDVISGFAIGLFLSWLWFKLFIFITHKYNL